jgi:hypothetical protein
MPKRPSGRPKATAPRDVLVLVRLTEAEADALCRTKDATTPLARFLRDCAFDYLHQRRHWRVTEPPPDTPEAQIQRARRAARRATTTADPALEAHLGQVVRETGEELV